jgi:hypothetical protein
MGERGDVPTCGIAEFDRSSGAGRRIRRVGLVSFVKGTPTHENRPLHRHRPGRRAQPRGEQRLRPADPAPFMAVFQGTGDSAKVIAMANTNKPK